MGTTKEIGYRIKMKLYERCILLYDGRILKYARIYAKLILLRWRYMKIVSYKDTADIYNDVRFVVFPVDGAVDRGDSGCPRMVNARSYWWKIKVSAQAHRSSSAGVGLCPPSGANVTLRIFQNTGRATFFSLIFQICPVCVRFVSIHLSQPT